MEKWVFLDIWVILRETKSSLSLSNILNKRKIIRSVSIKPSFVDSNKSWNKSNSSITFKREREGKEKCQKKTFVIKRGKGEINVYSPKMRIIKKPLIS